MAPNLRWMVASIVALAAVSACSDGSDGNESGASEPTAKEVLTASAEAMTGVSTAAFTIEQSGATVFIDDADQVAFQSAEGRFASPASAEAVIAVEAVGFRTEVGAVAIDGVVWITDPLSGSWTEAPANFSFDPSTLFDAEAGFPALLAESVTTAELVDDAGGTDVAGGDAATEAGASEPPEGRHLQTTVAAERIGVLTGGLVTEPTEVDLWIDNATNRINELRFDLPVDDEVSSWRMALSDYDAEVTIEAPQLSPS